MKHNWRNNDCKCLLADNDFALVLAAIVALCLTMAICASVSL